MYAFQLVVINKFIKEKLLLNTKEGEGEGRKEVN